MAKSAWMIAVAKTYALGKAKSAGYKYSQAMRDAKKIYKKGSKAEAAPKKKGPRKRRKRAVV